MIKPEWLDNVQKAIWLGEICRLATTCYSHSSIFLLFSHSLVAKQQQKKAYYTDKVYVKNGCVPQVGN